MSARRYRRACKLRRVRQRLVEGQSLRYSPYDRYGFTSRLWGLTMDNVIGATVVLANGSVVEASPSQHRDLYWVCPTSSCLKGALNVEGFLGTSRCSSILWHHYPIPIPDLPRTRAANVLQLQLVAAPGSIDSGGNTLSRLLLLTGDTKGNWLRAQLLPRRQTGRHFAELLRRILRETRGL